MGYKHYCSSNFAVTQGSQVLCAKSEKTSDFFECEDNVNYCDYRANFGTSQYFAYQLQCQCSQSDPSRRFCPLASNNETYIEGTRALEEHFENDAKRIHTTKRMILKYPKGSAIIPATIELCNDRWIQICKNNNAKQLINLYIVNINNIKK